MDTIISFILVINIAAFAIYGLDKYYAKHKMRRIPEKTLFLLAIIGGGLGCLAGMYTFRHKTKHVSFLLGIPAITLVTYTLAYFFLLR